MAGFGADRECLPFADEFVCFPRRHGEHGEIQCGEALHGEYIEWADGDAVLFAVAAVAIDDGNEPARFRLALAGEACHKDLDAGRYTQRE